MTQPKKSDELPAAVLRFDDLPDAALVSIEEAAKLIGAGVSTTWRRAATDPQFPRLIRLGRRCTRLEVGALRRWIASKASA